MLSRRYKLGVIALASLMLLTGCGSSDSEDATAAGQPGGSGGGLSTGACIPLSQAVIPFTGTDVYMDSVNLVGGNLPMMDSWKYSSLSQGRPSEGQVTTGGSAMNGGLRGFDVYRQGSVMIQMYPRQGTQYGYNSYQNRGDVVGTVQMGQTLLSQITGNQFLGNGNSYFPNNQFFPYNNSQSHCVSGVAFNLGHYPQGLIGMVYLYLNNSQNGVALSFGL